MYIRVLTFIAILAIALPSTALPHVDDVEEVASRLERRTSRSNECKITTEKFSPYCLPSNSKGFASSHNCADKGGKSYVCVQSGKATCYQS